jgi:hypothetical protein
MRLTHAYARRTRAGAFKSARSSLATLEHRAELSENPTTKRSLTGQVLPVKKIIGKFARGPTTADVELSVQLKLVPSGPAPTIWTQSFAAASFKFRRANKRPIDSHHATGHCGRHVPFDSKSAYVPTPEEIELDGSVKHGRNENMPSGHHTWRDSGPPSSISNGQHDGAAKGGKEQYDSVAKS